ncbi:MAG: pyroglutamyl-peptidase I [Clostridia bacterium]|nr:pyroglutamyl-peptidase I [Clostridia bacterium]
MRILLTAFEPFGGEDTNAALEAVQRVSAPAGVELERCTVPTVFGRCTETVLDAVRCFGPDVVVCVGQAAGRAAITPERVAINVREARIPDNAGWQPFNEPVDPDGPAAYFSRLPIHAIRDAIQSVGVPAAISDTAGTFVCNDLMYGLLRAIETEFPAMRGGFIHVPCTPQQAETRMPPLPSLPIEDTVRGLEAALTVL